MTPIARKIVQCVQWNLTITVIPIHHDPNGCFLILLISCCVVAASLMAEKTNVGVAVFVADNAYVCGFGSDGAAASTY